MTNIAILVGTTLGGSEYIADEMMSQLEALGIKLAFISPLI